MFTQSSQDPFHQPGFHWACCCKVTPSKRDLQFSISLVFLRPVCLADQLSPHCKYESDCNRPCCSSQLIKLTYRYHTVPKVYPLSNLKKYPLNSWAVFISKLSFQFPWENFQSLLKSQLFYSLLSPWVSQDIWTFLKLLEPQVSFFFLTFLIAQFF